MNVGNDAFVSLHRYLSTGMSFEAVAASFLMDSYTVGLIVREVCQSIYERLCSVHMLVPAKEHFKEIADNYERMWQFPRCLSVLE